MIRETIPHKITRISYNSDGWLRPTGDARSSEIANTYNRKYGFGHEDWLFRSDWQIDGWRYAFIQGVNKSRAGLLKLAKPFDLTLFTIEPDKRRRVVATIREVECLSDEQATEAVEHFRARGWYDCMKAEIRRVGGDENALGSGEYAEHILNVRFRQMKVERLPGIYAPDRDPILSFRRYQLRNLSDLYPESSREKGPRTGATTAPSTQPFFRQGSAPMECTPEHARMQAKLMLELRQEFPDAKIVREENFVDISVRTESETILFEIKSDLSPRTVIREALGQILEYAYYPGRTEHARLKIVIVGRVDLTATDRQYTDRLRRDFHLPIEYRVVSL